MSGPDFLKPDRFSAGAGEAGVTARRIMALALWTFVFLLFGMMFFGFAMMGDCYEGPEGAACRAAKNAAPARIWTGKLIVYLVLTWAIFIRRWWKR